MKDINANRIESRPLNNFRKISTWSWFTAGGLLWLSFVLQPAARDNGERSFVRNHTTFLENKWDLLNIDEYKSDNIVPVYHLNNPSGRRIQTEVSTQRSSTDDSVECSLLEDCDLRGSDNLQWKNVIVRQHQPLQCPPKRRVRGESREKVQRYHDLWEEKMQLSSGISSRAFQKKNYSSRTGIHTMYSLEKIERNLLIFLFFGTIINSVVIISIVFHSRMSKTDIHSSSNDRRISIGSNSNYGSSNQKGRMFRDCRSDMQSGENLLNRKEKKSPKQQDNNEMNLQSEGNNLYRGKKNLTNQYNGPNKAGRTVAESIERVILPRPGINTAKRGSKKKRRRCMVFVEDIGCDTHFQ